MTSVEFPRVVWEFVAATNACDRDWLAALFTDDCSVVACGFKAVGRSAVDSWARTELLDTGLTLKVVEVRASRDATVVRTQVAEGAVIHECGIAFRTEGRYIRAITITRNAVAHSPADQWESVRPDWATLQIGNTATLGSVAVGVDRSTILTK